MTAVKACKRFLRQILWQVCPQLFNKVVNYRGQIFSIGIYTGESPFCLESAGDMINPVLTAKDVTDIPAAFVADPFMCKVDGRWYMFFEVLNKVTRQGQIGLATSDDGFNWTYDQIVLIEPFHLAYPYVFEWRGKYYMIPDNTDNSVKLYEAADFPYEWRCVSKVLDGEVFVDSSIFCFRDKWWLFTASSAKRTPSRALRLYCADEPIGNWQEHPSSPILEANENISRPGGRVLIINDRPVRFAQDGFPAYGSRVRAFEILKLSSDLYHEQQIGAGPVLSAGRESWNNEGMHHVDAHSLSDGTWIACVDGWISG